MNDPKWFFIFAAFVMGSMLLADAHRSAQRIETVGKIVEACYTSGNLNCHELWNKEIQ